MEAIMNLKRVIENELQNTATKNSIQPNEWDNLGKAVDILKDISEICKMHYEMEEATGQNDYRSYSSGPSMRRGSIGWNTSYMPSRSYDSDPNVKADLQELMNNASTDHERMLVMKLMDKMGVQ